MNRAHFITGEGCWWLIVTVVNSRGKEVRSTYRVTRTVKLPRAEVYKLEKVPEKEKAEVWDVMIEDGQISCDCQDANWRRRQCKHCKIVLGLLKGSK